jgi:hypothetical protein
MRGLFALWESLGYSVEVFPASDEDLLFGRSGEFGLDHDIEAFENRGVRSGLGDLGLECATLETHVMTAMIRVSRIASNQDSWEC